MDIPVALKQLMAEIGPRWASTGAVAANVALMCKEFAKVLVDAPKDGVEVGLDIAYGDDPRQRLDVFRPDAARSSGKAAMPIVVFVHGGAFVEGDRNRNDEIYANVLYYFARHDIVGINMEYRLAPAHVYPSGTVDVGLAVAWARAHAAEIGGDPDQVFVMGHSAGGAHAASYAYDTQFHPAQGVGIRGLILVSGRVRAENRPENPNARKVEAYYGNDVEVMNAHSAVTSARADSVPTFIAFAEFENPLIDVHSLELASRLAQLQGRAPRVLSLRGHNHTSIVAHMNTSEDLLGTEILAFINDLRS